MLYFWFKLNAKQNTTMITSPAPAQSVTVIGISTGRNWTVRNVGTDESPNFVASMTDSNAFGNYPEIHATVYVDYYTREVVPSIGYNRRTTELVYDMRVHGDWEVFIDELQKEDAVQAQYFTGKKTLAGAHVGKWDDSLLVDGTNETIVFVDHQPQPTDKEVSFLKKNNLDKTDLGYTDNWE